MKYPKPLAAEINALPDHIRLYLHDLETRVDPAGDLAARRLAEDANRELSEAYQLAKAELTSAKEIVEAHDENLNAEHDPDQHLADMLKVLCDNHYTVIKDAEVVAETLEGIRFQLNLYGWTEGNSLVQWIQNGYAKLFEFRLAVGTLRKQTNCPESMKITNHIRDIQRDVYVNAASLLLLADAAPSWDALSPSMHHDLNRIIHALQKPLNAEIEALEKEIALSEDSTP